MDGLTALHNRYFEELRAFAELHSVPIMHDHSIEFIKKYIKEHNVKTILEIGTGIGYSCICMALVDKDIEVISIEKDERRYLYAIKNIKKFFLENRITLIYSDALKVNLNQKFDLILIDAAKGKYINFFEHFKKHLNKNGTIITDNVSCRDFIESNDELGSTNLRGLVNKIKNYIEFLKENKEFATEFLSVGDGLAISQKK
ncbi:MAG: O-methyltransferase [Bacilli bacterium]